MLYKKLLASSIVAAILLIPASPALATRQPLLFSPKAETFTGGQDNNEQENPGHRPVPPAAHDSKTIPNLDKETGETQTGIIQTPIPGIASRISGSNRYETAAQIAAQGFPNGAETVTLINGAHPADGLPAATGQNPILYVDSQNPTQVVNQIVNLHPKKVIAVGKDSLPQALHDQIQNRWEIQHVWGNDRVETATKLAAAMFPEGAPQVTLVASGTETNPAPDAIPAAATTSGPILYVGAHGLGTETLENLLQLHPSQVRIIGGNSAITPQVEQTLREQLPSTQIERIGGVNRYETAMLLANFVTNRSRVYLVRSDAYLDAISAATLHDGAILYQPVNSPVTDANESIVKRWNTPAVAVGGVGGEIDSVPVVFFDDSKLWHPAPHTEFPVNYVSQLKPYYIPQGCELISLFMALRTKGHALNVSTADFVAHRPQHPTNPFKGYAGSPFHSTPGIRNTINPGPLAMYGRQYGADIVDMSGQSFDAVIKQVQHGNPVVLFLTSFYAPPRWEKFYIEGSWMTLLRNNHVVVAHGYDVNTRQILLADPYSASGAPLNMWKSRAQIEALYNARHHAIAVLK